MGSLNKVQLIGNLGRDCEVRYTAGGIAVANFSIATTETWKDKNGARQEKTEWHHVVLWGKVAEALHEFLVKGKQIYVEGRLRTREWEDKQGAKRHTTEVSADNIVLLGGGSSAGSGGQRRRVQQSDEAQEQPIGVGAEISDDDIPFVFFAPLLAPLAGAILAAGGMLG